MYLRYKIVETNFVPKVQNFVPKVQNFVPMCVGTNGGTKFHDRLKRASLFALPYQVDLVERAERIRDPSLT